MFRIISVFLFCSLYLFVNPVFAAPAKPSSNIPESFRPHLIHHIQKQASSEYEVQGQTVASAGYRAENASHKLALGFSTDGVDVRPANNTAWHMGMKLSAIGYGKNMNPIASGEMTASGNRVEYRHIGTGPSPQLSEWYLNGPLGLEQGFTLNQPPAGKHKENDLVLTLTLSGDLTAVPNDKGREVQFQTAQGRTALRFRDLYVFDATGKKLASKFITASNGYGIQVDDTSAVYPLTIDPLLVTETKLNATDAAEDDFLGTSMAISGDTVVVGATGGDDGGFESGSAYVFVRSGDVWTEEQKLIASDDDTFDFFGDSVAISGDTVVVGATGNDDAGTDSGSAYVFTRSGTTWTEEQKLTAGDAATRDFFGRSVAVNGDTVVVGATGDDDGGQSSGSAYVFTRSGTTWTQQTKLTAELDAGGGDQFGNSAAIDGNTVVVGAPFDNDAASSSGSAYVFTGAGSSWSRQAKLNAGDAAADDNFGFSVAISGDTAVVGASGENSLGGAAYVFVRSGTTWSEQDKLTANDGAADDNFGGSVAVSGDTVVVGASGGDDAGTFSGSAYVFVRSGTTWSQQTKLTASDAALNAFFGTSAAVSGNTVVVGASGGDGAVAESGAVYVYKLEVVPDPPQGPFSGTLSGPIFCVEGSQPLLKIKFKDNVTLSVDTSLFPVITAVVELDRLGTFNLTGMALLKNPKSGVLQLFGDDGNSRELALSGTIKINKKTGDWVSLKGKFQFISVGGEKCTMTGKFKAK
jgi:FG-GAP repeat